MKTIAASQFVVGSEVAAADGYLFTVLAIVRRTPKTVTVSLGSAFSPISTIRNGVEKTFRLSSRYRVPCDGRPGDCGHCAVCEQAERAVWSKPYYGVQHLLGVPKTHQITVEDHVRFATVCVLSLNSAKAFTPTSEARFDTVAEARAWGEMKAGAL